jgi:hypothetical protein
MLKTLIMLVAVATLIWGCVEDLDTGRNYRPLVWFTRMPDSTGIIYDNSIEFEWVSTDVDDDLGMGATYVHLTPNVVQWLNLATDSTVTFEHPEGWQRVYEDRYEIIDLPDSEFVFSVRVVDGRGAADTIRSTFEVRFDNLAPVRDSIQAPAAKQDAADFLAYFRIYAHDIARSPWNATPVESLEYWYRFVSPCDPAIESRPEWSTAHDEFETWVTGSSCQGKYTFWYKIRDQAGNQSDQLKAEFEVTQ